MRRNTSRKSYNKEHNTFSFILSCIFVLLIIGSICFAAYSHLSLNSSRKEYNSMVDKITIIGDEKNEIKHDIKNLESSVKDKNDNFKEMMSNAKIAYLTFDDGPSSNTKDILNILDKYNIKATFFVNGHQGLEPLYREIIARGHVIANHTYSHDYKDVYSSIENFKANVNKLNDFVEKVTGNPPAKILRYPGGSNNQVSWQYSGRGFMKELVKSMQADGYTFFDWNLDSTDASAYRQKKSKIISSILDNAKYVRKANILMHDLGPKTTTVQALPEVIEGLQEQGFIFDSLSKDSYKHQFTKLD